ncbi:hypothetical protein ACE7GA_22325 [Roseomonas sp. CCTCC AB2023176]|uniref:hypothetical protein n=1 Tax=Roseomonas sp. CCTCC AB2023176 TaxID=3342640 RepID=UPI0035DE2B29
MSAVPIPPAAGPVGGPSLQPVSPTGPAAGTADAFENALRQLGAATSPPGVLAEKVAHGLQAFRGRAEVMSRDVVGAMTPAVPAAAPAAPPAPGSAAPAGAVQPAANPADPQGIQGMYRMVVRTFDFAMETHLVAKAATQFTGSVNTLMKGQ